jgi:hypothetical protein
MPHFGDLTDRLLELAGQDSGGEFQTMVENTINRFYRYLLNVQLSDEQIREFSLTLPANASKVGFPLNVKSVMIVEDGTNDKTIDQITRTQFYKDYPGKTDSGTPEIRYNLGRFGVEKQPSADGIITVESDVSTDTGDNYVIRVNGFNTAGVQVEESITMTGLTAASSTISFDSELGVERVLKYPAEGYAFTGNVTVKDAAGNTMAVIPTWVDSPNYIWNEFYPVNGSTAATYTVSAKMRKPELVNRWDWPEVDEDLHALLVDGPAALLLPLAGKAQAALGHRELWREGLRQMGADMAENAPVIQVFQDVQAFATRRVGVPSRVWVRDAT